MHRPQPRSTRTRRSSRNPRCPKAALLVAGALYALGAAHALANEPFPYEVASGPSLEPLYTEARSSEGLSTHAITGKPSHRSSPVWSLLAQFGRDEGDDDPAGPRLADVTSEALEEDEPPSVPTTAPVPAPETDAARVAPEDAGGTADEGDAADPGSASMKELSQQTANPVGKYAFIFTQFATTFSQGDGNRGDAKVAGNIVFQPIIPIPLLGEDENEWRIVTRPTLNFFISQPIPRRSEDRGRFHREGGMSDLLIPLPIALPESIVGRALVAAGPSFSLPTATDDDFGKQQWTAGVSGVFGYIGDNWMAGAYPQYYWRIADAGRRRGTRRASFGNMFYWFLYNITDDWQIGLNPTIQYDHKASRGNRWNVPVGLIVSRVTTIFGKPFRWEAGVEYSAVSQDDFGEIARIKINLLPIVPRPIQKPLLGFMSRLGR